MQLRTIPRTSICASLQLTRIPLSVAERATGNDGNDAWPPLLAYDSFQANVKQVVGSLINDAELIHQGELEQARVTTVREARTLEAVAAQTKGYAERQYEDRTAADERALHAAQARATQREQDAERQRAEAKQQAAADARAEAERARAQDKKREDQLETTERAAKASAIAAERKALAASKRAATSKARAMETDKKLKAAKARRSAS